MFPSSPPSLPSLPSPLFLPSSSSPPSLPSSPPSLPLPPPSPPSPPSPYPFLFLFYQYHLTTPYDHLLSSPPHLPPPPSLHPTLLPIRSSISSCASFTRHGAHITLDKQTRAAQRFILNNSINARALVSVRWFAPIHYQHAVAVVALCTVPFSRARMLLTCAGALLAQTRARARWTTRRRARFASLVWFLSNGRAVKT